MDNILECKECGKLSKTVGGLKNHLRVHLMSQEQYFHKHYPRKDKYSGELIPFRNEEEYFKSEFKNRSNFNKWVNSTESSEVRQYLSKRLDRLYEEREPRFIISSSELETLGEPDIFLYERFLGSYHDFCSKYVKETKFSQSNISLQNVQNLKIIVAKNEQNPFKLKNSSFGTLKFGDYCLEDESISDRVRIERKSAFDFIGTLTSGYERFGREIRRAKSKGYTIVVLVEATVRKLLNPDYNRFSKANPQFYFHNMRKLCQENENLQFVFCSGRNEAQKRCRMILENGKILKSQDIHYIFKKYDLLSSEL